MDRVARHTLIASLLLSLAACGEPPAPEAADGEWDEIATGKADGAIDPDFATNGHVYVGASFKDNRIGARIRNRIVHQFDQPEWITANFCAAFVSFVFARSANRHLHQTGGHWRENHDG